jgi:regulator of replication initiation timing
MMSQMKSSVVSGARIFLASSGGKSMMTFYNYIENVRYEMFNLVNDWTRKGAETKARISQSLDQARDEYNQLKVENDKLRKLCAEQGIEVDE